MMVLSPFLVALFGWRGLWQVNALGRNLLKNLIKDIWLTVKAPGPLLFALCFAAYAFQFVVVIGFLPTLLFEEHGVTQTRAAILSAIVVAVNAPGNLLGGWLLQKGIKRWHLVAVANSISGLCCLLLCLVFSGVGGMFPAAALHGAAVTAPTPELVATSQGLLLQGAQLGLLTGPPIVATVVLRTGHWQSASWVLMAAALLVVALSFVLRAVERREGIE
jgi:hypothetical protein